MITDYEGNRLTPKQKAQDLLMSAMMTALYHLNDDQNMTETEKERVAEQMEKQKQRIERLFGYQAGSWRFE